MIDFDALLRPQSTTAVAEGGRVFAIRAVPDLFTGEVLNVGVCVITPTGTRLVKVIDRPGRLECLYGDGAHELVQLARQAGECAVKGLAFPGENVVLDSPVPFFNMSPEAALETYFADLVTVALEQPKERRVQHLTTEDAREQVATLLKRLRPTDALDNLVPESPNILINVNDKPRLVNVPLQPPGGAGTIESADYAAETIRFHLLDRVTDLSAVHQAGKARELAMFIVRPERRLSEKQLRTVDNAIDKVLWKVPKQMRVEVESLDRTAELVLEWAEHVSRGDPSGGFALGA